jgi:hypothetical protein
MIALGIVLAVLLLICLIRVGIIVVYSEDGFTADAVIGFIRLRLVPRRDKKAGKKASKRQAAEGAVKAGRLASLKQHLPSINQALSKLKRRLVITQLTIYYMAAGTDPAATAMSFGGVSAGYGILLPLLENNFNVKKRDLRATVNFNAAEPYIYVKARLSLAVWEAINIGFGLVKNLVKSGNMRAKIRKAV